MKIHIFECSGKLFVYFSKIEISNLQKIMSPVNFSIFFDKLALSEVDSEIIFNSEPGFILKRLFENAYDPATEISWNLESALADIFLFLNESQIKINKLEVSAS